jgi:DNA primase
MAANLEEIKQLPIREVATRLGIHILPGNKAMCFGGHDKRTPSLSFETKRNIWNCFGCGKKGDSITLVENVLNCDFMSALDWFAKQYRVNVHRNDGTKPQVPRWWRAVPRAPQEIRREGETHPDPEMYTWLIEKCDLVADAVWLDYLERHGIPLHLATEFGVRQLTAPTRIFRQLVEKWVQSAFFEADWLRGFREAQKV